MKYLRIFNNDAEHQQFKVGGDYITPNVCLIKETNCIKLEVYKPTDIIYYTSSDGNIVTHYNRNVFGANIISNTYENGKGIIKFDGDVTSIGDYAFYCRTSLTSVNIPYSVISIGRNAFYGCSGLTSITISDSVTEIGDWAFYSCKSLKAFYGKLASEDNRCLIVNGTLHSFAPAGITSYTIPNGVTSIGNDVFRDCTSLTSVTIGNGVTSIGDSAFYGCSGLTSVNIPYSVTSIGISAFQNCKSLTSITIPNGVTSIGSSAFNKCTSLTSVTIGNGVTSIGNDVFRDCTSLTSVTIGNGVTSIGNNAFRDCTSLTNVTIPDSVTSIGKYAFYDCKGLTSVYCKPTTPPTIEKYLFINNPSYRKIYVPRNSVEAYKAASYWSDYASYIEGYDF